MMASEEYCKKALRFGMSSNGAESEEQESKVLDLQDVKNIVNDYSDLERGVMCRTCGKLYMFRSWLVKHLWEHTVYWQSFAGEKSQDRVLGIQAALILHAMGSGDRHLTSVKNLVVASPNPRQRKHGSRR